MKHGCGYYPLYLSFVDFLVDWNFTFVRVNNIFVIRWLLLTQYSTIISNRVGLFHLGLYQIEWGFSFGWGVLSGVVRGDARRILPGVELRDN